MCFGFFLILLMCTMVSLVKCPFSTCLWWPLHLDNWYLSLCIGHGGDRHAVPVLLVKVKYSMYMMYVYIYIVWLSLASRRLYNILYFLWLYNEFFIILYNILKIAELDCCQIIILKYICTIYTRLYTCLTSIPRFSLRDKVTLRLLKLLF